MAAVGAFLAGVVGASAPVIGSATFGAWVAGVSLASSATGSILGRLLLSVALSSLSQALQPKQRTPGIRTRHTQTGGTNPEAFVLGEYATEGTLIAPPMSHSRPGKNENFYLNYVIELSSLPGAQLKELHIDGSKVAFGDTEDPSYGVPIEGQFAERVWLRFYDGTQTTADPMLMEKYPIGSLRPWTSDMVGTGICYVVLTFRYDREVFSSFPKIRAVLQGVPLYDPRNDSSVGGEGAQRWDDPSTWEVSLNNAVQVYNILRGLPLPGGDTWGGDAAAQDLPLSNWFAAMNACDLPIAIAGGGTEPQFRSGFEVLLEDEPASVIEEILKGCSGQIAEVGGVWKLRVGGPGLPVFFFSDDDVIVDDPREFDPFPSIADTFNGIHANYPEPQSNWESRDAAPIYSAEYEAEDGERRLVADLSLVATPYAGQVQRVMQAYVNEERRFRRHVVSLPADAIPLEPLDAVAWTSPRNGYTAKVFEIASHVDPLVTSKPRLSLRERDPSDYDGFDPIALPTALAGGAEFLTPQRVEGFEVEGVSLEDGAGRARRPAIRLKWDWDLADTARGLHWEIRLASSAETVLQGSTNHLRLGLRLITAGILPATAYQLRAELDMSAPSEWSPWIAVTTPDVRISASDIAQEVTDRIASAQAEAAAAVERAEVVLNTASAHTDQLREDVTGALGALERVTTLSDDMAGLRDQQIEDVSRLDTALELRHSREIQTTQAQGEIYQQLLDLQIQASRLHSTLTEAGIVVDPGSGKVTIEAVSRLDGQIGEVQILVDAVQASLSLTASYTDLANMIAVAQLGPENMPVLTEIQGRISTAEVSLDAMAGVIASKSDTLMVEGLAITLTETLALIDSIDAALTQRVHRTEFDAINTRVTSAETQLSGLDGARFSLALTDIQAARLGQEYQSSASLHQLLDGFFQRDQDDADLAYLRQDMVALVEEGRESLAALSTSLGVAVGDTIALIETEVKTRVTQSNAMAASMSALQVDVGGARAGLDQVNLIEADSESAAARALHQLQLDVEHSSGGQVAQGVVLEALELRVEDSEAGLEIAASDRRQLSAGISQSDDAASLANLRSLLLNRTATDLFSAGLADAREDFYARVRDGEEATAGELSELTAGLAGALALVSLERVARVLGDQAEAAARVLLAVAMEQTSADLAQETRVRVTQETATAQQITEATARLEDVAGEVDATAAAQNSLGGTVSAQGTAIVAVAGRTSELEATVEDAETGVAATASVLSATVAQVAEIDGDINSLSADVNRLSLRDGSNLVPGGQITNADLWLLYQGWSLIAPAAIAGIKSPGILRFTAPEGSTGWSQSAQSDFFEVIEDALYTASFQARRDGAGQVAFRAALVSFDINGDQLAYEVLAEPTILDAEVHSFQNLVSVPAGAVLAQVRFLVNLNASTTGGDIAAPRIERQSDAATRLGGDIEQIYALNIDAATAFGSLLENLEVEAGGRSARVERQGTALATLAGNAEASYTFRVAAGDASSGLELVAADDPIAGPTSLLRLNAQHIQLDGNVAVAGDFLTDTLLAQSAWIQNAMIAAAQVGTLHLGENAVSFSKSANRNDQIAGVGYTSASDPWLTYMQIEVDPEHLAQAIVVDAALTVNGATVAGADTWWSLRILRQDTGNAIFSTQAELRQPSIYARGLVNEVAPGPKVFLLQYRLGTGLQIQNCSMTATVTYR